VVIRRTTPTRLHVHTRVNECTRGIIRDNSGKCNTGALSSDERSEPILNRHIFKSIFWLKMPTCASRAPFTTQTHDVFFIGEYGKEETETQRPQAMEYRNLSNSV